MRDSVIVNRAVQSEPPKKQQSTLAAVCENVAALAGQLLGFKSRLVALEQRAPAKDGKDGVCVQSGTINDVGDLVLTMSDDREINCGHVRGADGVDGKDASSPKTMRTRVTKHDEQGRVLEFVREEIE